MWRRAAGITESACRPTTCGIGGTWPRVWRGLGTVPSGMFVVPFAEIAPIVGRSGAATRQLTSRARRRVRAAAVVPDVDLARQQAVVDAFFAAARDGDFAALLAVLDPDVVVRADGGPVRVGASRVVRGAVAVAEETLTAGGFPRLARLVQPALVNGAAGVVVAPRGRLSAILGFTVRRGKIVEIDILARPSPAPPSTVRFSTTDPAELGDQFLIGSSSTCRRSRR